MNYLLLLILFSILIIRKNKIILKNCIKSLLIRIDKNNFGNIYKSFTKVFKLKVFILSSTIGSIGWGIECFGIYKLLDYPTEYNLSIFKAVIFAVLGVAVESSS